MAPLRRKMQWMAVKGSAGLIGAALAGKALDVAFRRARGKEPPRTPGVRGVKWRQAVAWAAVMGMAVAVGQLLATGAASAAWKRGTGRKPPR